MNERDEVARLLPELADRDLPSGRERRLQEHVMSQIEQDRPAVEPERRGRTRRYAIAASAVAAAAAIAVAVSTGGFGLAGGGSSTTGPSGGTANTAPVVAPKPAALSPVAQTFELAAQYASAKPFIPPRPNQWIFVRNRELAPSTLAKDKGQSPDYVSQTWRRVDGTQMAGVLDGRLQTWTQSSDYLAISALPTDPKAMLAAVRARLLAAPSRGNGPLATGGGEPAASDGKVFAAISRMLNDYLLPPATTAALMRAAALIPGVRLVPGTVDAYGHRAIAVGRLQEGWLSEQLLLDPDTYDFVGYRSVAAKDHTLFPGPGALHIKKGEVQFITTRLAATVVDRQGQTS